MVQVLLRNGPVSGSSTPRRMRNARSVVQDRTMEICQGAASSNVDARGRLWSTNHIAPCPLRSVRLVCAPLRNVVVWYGVGYGQQTTPGRSTAGGQFVRGRVARPEGFEPPTY
jgi:hypothetical protein